MTTKKLYSILDKVLLSGVEYNLRKVRNAHSWRVRLWATKALDKLGILAPFVESEIYPEHYEIDDTIADFKAICKTALKTCK